MSLENQKITYFYKISSDDKPDDDRLFKFKAQSGTSFPRLLEIIAWEIYAEGAFGHDFGEEEKLLIGVFDEYKRLIDSKLVSWSPTIEFYFEDLDDDK